MIMSIKRVILFTVACFALASALEQQATEDNGAQGLGRNLLGLPKAIFSSGFQRAKGAVEQAGKLQSYLWSSVNNAKGKAQQAGATGLEHAQNLGETSLNEARNLGKVGVEEAQNLGKTSFNEVQNLGNTGFQQAKNYGLDGLSYLQTIGSDSLRAGHSIASKFYESAKKIGETGVGSIKTVGGKAAKKPGHDNKAEVKAEKVAESDGAKAGDAEVVDKADKSPEFSQNETGGKKDKAEANSAEKVEPEA